MDKVKKPIKKKPKAPVIPEEDTESILLPIPRFRKLFKDYVKTETLNGKDIETIVFFDDTLENLKPVYDKYDKTLEFDEKDKDSRLYIYMPLDEFWDLFEPALLDCGESLDDMLKSMITYEHEHNLGHDLFLSIVWEIRNPKPIITITEKPGELKQTQRKFY